MEFKEYDHQNPYQPPQPPQPPRPSLLDDERLMGVLAWVLQFFTSFIGPLIIYLINDKRSAFIDQHARGSLNVCISVFIYSIIGAIGMFILTFIFPPLAFLSFLYFGAIAIYTFVVTIKGAIAASRLEAYTPPLTIQIL
ncbi:MAG TPA: DUF4870 domain-containing protein [Haloplasmataceae bacterium]